MPGSSVDALLVYSNYCRFCESILKQVESRSNIKYICVDKKEVREKLPSYISSVPTLIVSNKMFVGDEITKWLQNTQQKKPVLQQPQEPQMYSEPTFSTDFSFITEDTTAEGDGGLLSSYAYSSLNENSSAAGKIDSYVPNPSGRGGYSGMPAQIQQSEKAKILDSKMEEMMSMREKDMPAMPMRH